MLALFETWSAQSLFVMCALVGGGVLSLQLVLLLFGVGVDADVDLDMHEGDGMGFLSIRTLSTLIATFGLVGWWALDNGYTTGTASLFGILAGLVMMALVAWLFSLQSKLTQEGNVDPAGAVGRTALVYLRVPAVHEGPGKITVELQGRTHEFSAVTSGAAIPTGAEVRIVRQVAETTFEVEPA
ncbi:MAG: hypothetical protein R3F17_04350 [Planctomycetota bacterium]